MSARHTPGPWAVFERGIRAGSICTIVHRIKWWACGLDESEEMANARLIAAAPELLDAVALARAQIKEDRDALAQCHTDPSGYVDKLGAAALSEYDETLSLIDAAIAKATGATP